MKQDRSSKTQKIVLYTSGPLFALLGLLTAQRAMQTTSQNEALLFALLATLFGTVFFGWIIFVILLVRFRSLDRKDKK